MDTLSKRMTAAKRIAVDWGIGPSYAYLNLRRRMLQSRRSIADPAVVRLNHKRIHRLMDWGLREFAPVLSKWWDAPETATPLSDPQTAPIWMVWLQGADRIPEKYHRCIDSVRRCNPGRPIRILDESQILELVDVPDIIMNLYRAGNISPVLFTDYVRFALLERYGGIWMDMTLFQTRKPNPSMLEHPMWCIKGLEPFPYATAIPDGLDWQSYYVASQPHALFCKVVPDLFERYFATHTLPFDYFFIYYLAAFARTVPAVRQSWESIPDNNSHCEQLMPLIESDASLSSNLVNRVLLSTDTWIYKGSSHLTGKQLHRSDVILDLLDSSFLH